MKLSTPTNLPEIRSGNQPPEHDEFVAVIVKPVGKPCYQVNDRRIGKTSWMFWKNVIAWQELPEETK